MSITINRNDVRRHGTHIRLGQGRTAIERPGGTLVIRDHGKQIKSYRGSSIEFNIDLGEEDRAYLASLGSDA